MRAIRLNTHLFENQGYPEVLDRVSYISSAGNAAEFSGLSKTANPKEKWDRINYVPGYLDVQLQSGFGAFRHFHVDGFAIDLEGEKSLGSYISKQLKPRLRQAVRNKPAALEKDFDIRYEQYFGAMDRALYDKLMGEFREMILARFNILGKKHERIADWERVQSIFYDLICNKQASLYVVFNGNAPIAMSLNHHLPPIFFMSILSFDPAYSRYSLGHLLISRQVDWCLQNGYTLFNFGMGDLRYKRDWCNRIYGFYTWFVYRKGNWPSMGKAGVGYCLFALKMILKSWGVDRFYHFVLRLKSRMSLP